MPTYQQHPLARLLNPLLNPLQALRTLARNPVALERGLGVLLWLGLIAVLLTKGEFLS